MMTRKQALCKALEVINDRETEEVLRGIIAQLPLISWTEDTIFDSIEQFIADNGRVPMATDFKRRGLPPHPVIKLRFGITLREFLEKNYPTKHKRQFSPYNNKDREEWKADFIENYKKIKPKSMNEYNLRRPKSSPTWITVARMFECSRWLDLLALCDIQNPNCRLPRTYTVIAHPDIDIPRGGMPLTTKHTII